MGIKKPEFGDLRRFDTQAYIYTKTVHKPLYGAVWVEIKHIRAGMAPVLFLCKRKDRHTLSERCTGLFQQAGEGQAPGLRGPA